MTAAHAWDIVKLNHILGPLIVPVDGNSTPLLRLRGICAWYVLYLVSRYINGLHLAVATNKRLLRQFRQHIIAKHGVATGRYRDTRFHDSTWMRRTKTSQIAKATNVSRVYHTRAINNAFSVLVLPQFNCVSGMLAEAHINCFYMTMRTRCASLGCRVRASSNRILTMIADEIDCRDVNHRNGLRYCKLIIYII